MVRDGTAGLQLLPSFCSFVLLFCYFLFPPRFPPSPLLSSTPRSSLGSKAVSQVDGSSVFLNPRGSQFNGFQSSVLARYFRDSPLFFCSQSGTQRPLSLLIFFFLCECATCLCSKRVFVCANVCVCVQMC